MEQETHQRNLHQRQRSNRPRPVPAWVVIAAALLVLFVAAVGSDLLDRFSDKRRRQETALIRVEGLANRLIGLEWQSEADTELEVDLNQQITATKREMKHNLRGMVGLDQSGYLARRVASDFYKYEKDIAVLFQLTHEGKHEEAAAYKSSNVDPSYTSLLNSIWYTQAVYDKQGEQAKVMADLGSNAALVLAAAAMSFLFWKRERAQRNTEMAEAQERARSEARFRSLVQNSSDVITVIQPDTTIFYQSPAVERVFGYPPADLLNRQLNDFVDPEDTPRLLAFLSEAMAGANATSSLEFQLRHKDGTWRRVETVATNLLSDPDVAGIVLNTRDVTDRHQLQEQLEHQALHDPLTNLANRALFSNRVEHALSRASRASNTIAVIFMDLDDFKTVNDSLGHQAGDELLTAVAQRVQDCLRPSDTAARLGGDEFAVLLEEMTDMSDAARVAERITEALQTPFTLLGEEFFTHASLGIAVSPTGRGSAEELLRNADIAMYMAKARGKARYELFHPDMHEGAVRRLAMEADLRRAVQHVQRQEFTVHYQPIIELSSKKIIGLEALVRWAHPQRGLIPPLDFIPMAEENGLIIPIGQWILSESCRQTRIWQMKYPRDPALSISINISAKQLVNPGLVLEVSRALQSAAMEPGSLTLEITESVLIQDTEATIRRLNELRAIGVKLAIDDFGTGYSSLSYLKRLPVDFLKIDKSFVDGLATRSEDLSLAQSIVRMAESQNLQTVAEGIEDADQLEKLISIGCPTGQGYLFARPVDASATGDLLSKALTGEPWLPSAVTQHPPAMSA